jgi:hypothetical protein
MKPSTKDEITGPVRAVKANTKAKVAQITLRLSYKKAVDEWVDTIRAEEALATPGDSMVTMERWDAAHFREQDAHTKAREAREAYKDELRSVNYGF